MISISYLFLEEFNPDIHSHTINSSGEYDRTRKIGSAEVTKSYFKRRDGSFSPLGRTINIHDNGSKIASGSTAYSPRFDKTEAADVSILGVNKSYEGMGLGNKILKHLVKGTKEDNQQNIGLRDASTNNAWKHFSPVTKNSEVHVSLPVNTALSNLKNVGNAKLSTILKK